jgi:predicted porin
MKEFTRWRSRWPRALSTIVLSIAGPAAVAQTAVTLYGVADGGIRFDHTAIGTLRSVISGGQSASRWGLRGTEDLGDGLKAVFIFEDGVDISDNSNPQGNITPQTPSSPVSSSGSRIFGRTASVGLQSNYGNLKFGRDYSPYYNVWQGIDPFLDGTLGKVTNVAPIGGTRLDNGIYADTPVLHGFQAHAAYSMGESTTDSPTLATKRGGDIYSMSLSYAAGPVLAGYGYYHSQNAVETNAVRAHTLGGIYDFRLLKVHVLLFSAKNDARTLDQRTYYGGMTIPHGAWQLLLGFAHLADRTANLRSANFQSLALIYSLSKRTDLYTSAAHFVNGSGGSFTIQDSGSGGLYTAANVPPGFNPTSVEFGMRFRF